MSYQIFLFFSLFALFSGCSLSSFACIVFGKICHKKYASYRFSLVFFFLSAAIAVFTLGVFVADGFLDYFKDPVNFSNLPLDSVIFFAAVFIASGIICAFWKIALPAAVSLYIAVSVYQGYYLYKTFGVPGENYSVTVTESEIYLTSDAQDGSLKFPIEEGLSAEVFMLNPKWILPLPKMWFVFSGNGTELFEKLPFLTKKMLEPSFIQEFHLPEYGITPVLFDLNIDTDKGTVDYVFTRAL